MGEQLADLQTISDEHIDLSDIPDCSQIAMRRTKKQ
jgi:hypothetical protein